MRLLGPVAVGVLFIASVSAQAPAPPALWSLSGDFALPESAYHDAMSNSIFVSSINGDLLAKDGNGYISRLSPDGKMINAKWATGLNGPKGMRASGRTLWVSDIDEVVALDINSGMITSRVKIDGATFLNDLATGPDGTVYVSDSQGSRVYAVKDGKATVFVEGAEAVQQANGLLVDNGRLILGTVGPAAAGGGRGPAAARGRGDAPQGPPAAGREGAAPAPARGGAAARGGVLVAFDLKTKARTQLTAEPVGGVDGIEPDGRGGLVITDVFGSRIVHVAASGATRTLLQLPAAGADFAYIASTRTAVVPFLFGNSVSAYDLTAALK